LHQTFLTTRHSTCFLYQKSWRNSDWLNGVGGKYRWGWKIHEFRSIGWSRKRYQTCKSKQSANRVPTDLENLKITIGCILPDAHNTVFGSKVSAICLQAVYFLHSTRPCVTRLNSRRWLDACDWVMSLSALSAVLSTRVGRLRKFKEFSCTECIGQGNDFELNSTVDVLCSNFVKFGRLEISEILRSLRDKKKTKFRLALQLSLLRGSCPKSARSSHRQCSRFHLNRFFSAEL